MDNSWRIAEAYNHGLLAQAFGSLESVFDLQGDEVSRDKISDVIKVELDGKNFYVKRYSKPRTKKIGWFIRSRIRAEWENLQFFAALGIATPKVVAYGEVYKGAVFRGALITEEFVEAKDLASLCREGSDLFDRRDWWQCVAKQVALYTSLIHDKQFMHLDLKWRNILVGPGEKPEVYFFDCPSGKRLPKLLFRRGRLKDLACLDQIARDRLRATQRLAFYKYYAGCKKLTDKDKAVVRKVIRFSAYIAGESDEPGWRIF